MIAIRSIDPGQVRILWSATVGKRYVIQSKPLLDAVEWTNADEPVIANASTMLMDLAGASASAFYRAVLVQ